MIYVHDDGNVLELRLAPHPAKPNSEYAPGEPVTDANGKPAVRVEHGEMTLHPLVMIDVGVHSDVQAAYLAEPGLTDASRESASRVDDTVGWILVGPAREALITGLEQALPGVEEEYRDRFYDGYDSAVLMLEIAADVAKSDQLRLAVELLKTSREQSLEASEARRGHA